MLCSLYYGQMERDHPDLAGLVFQDRDLLMRLVDDFLLITPDINIAKKFMHVMSTGIPEYNCFINNGKSLINFDADMFPRLSANTKC
jgi:telomerase reverse transcriptase